MGNLNYPRACFSGELRLPSTDSELSEILYELRKKEFYEDFSGFMHQVVFLNSIINFLENMIKHEKKNKTLNQKFLKEIKYYKNRFKFWSIIANNYSDLTLAYKILSCEWNLKVNIENILNDKEFKHLLSTNVEEFERKFMGLYYKNE